MNDITHENHVEEMTISITDFARLQWQSDANTLIPSDFSIIYAYNFAPGPSSTTEFTSVPIPPPIHVLTLSPSLRYTGGFLTKPTPFGVPVMMIEPGSRVVPCERADMVCRTVNTWCLGVREVITVKIYVNVIDIIPTMSSRFEALGRSNCM